MKRFFWTAFTAFLAFTACGPSRHSIHVEMRYPSKSGMELSGKSISVVCLENESESAALLSEGIADGFAYTLEKDYATGEGSVKVFRMKPSHGAVYSSKDSLFNLLMDTGADVLFLMDTLTLGNITVGDASRVSVPASDDSAYVSSCRLSLSLRLYGFDAMNKEEKVYSFSGSTFAVADVYSDGSQSVEAIESKAVAALPDAGWDVGETMAASFISQWKHEQYSIVYFESDSWYRALNFAEQYYWKEAMDIWMELSGTGDLLKRSCAAYNIAVACYMAGDYDLAGLWLDRSDEDGKLPYSDSLRKRINARK